MDHPDDLFKPLYELFPEPAIELIRLLASQNAEHKRIEPWRERQIMNFFTILTVCAAEFQKAHQRRSIGAFAWATRSILELSVWIDYCNVSDAHAKRFHEDELRDASGLLAALASYDRQTGGNDDRFFEKKMDALSLRARELGITDPNDEFKRVSEAASEIGRKHEFTSVNKMLSKLVHPTAYAVGTIIRIDDSSFYEVMLEIGVPLIVRSYSKLKSAIVTYFPEARTDSMKAAL